MPKKLRTPARTTTSASVEEEFARLAATLGRKEQTPLSTDTRRARGLRKLTEAVGVKGGRVMNELVDASPDLARFIVDFAYGDVIARDRLDDRTRALVVVAALAALGNARPQLEVHVGTALNSGCTREDIIETLLVVAVYAGFPAALNGLSAAQVAMRDVTASPRRRRRPGK